ncbi:Protein ARV1 [Seminavis robusta]|uniref:Protein ARV n=1 Tax=Seminavis robusta TaxID=568900 RepID=A0A9N8F105_9STRA|nr:Protein ARV1 [Seminavis robusta]|eukprot:Sro2502_g329480.1 Protein ARV1 (325) ;mRNA; f:4037-5011
MPSSYHCIHCLSPSDSTHRQFGREIKLTSCSQCGQNVDPYVERDGLLVAMDCLLLREEAYRHVLCNHPISTYISTRTDLFLQYRYSVASAVVLGYLLTTSTSTTSTSTSTTGLLFLTLLVQLLGLQEESPNHSSSSSSSWWAPLLLCAYSFCGNLLLTVGIQGGYSALARIMGGSQHQGWHNLSSRLYLAVLLPTAFHVNTILVLMVWENDNTAIVRQLASLLVLNYQFLMSTVAMQLQWATSSPVNSNNKEPIYYTSPLDIRWLIAFGTGLVLRSVGCAFLRWLVARTIIQGQEDAMDIPCILGVSGSDLHSSFVEGWGFCIF